MRSLPSLLAAVFLGLGTLSIACSAEDAANGPSHPSSGDETESAAPPSSPSTAADAGAPESDDPPPTSSDAGSDASKPAKSYALGNSAGCSKTSGATGLLSGTMTIAGKKREFLRFVPAGYEPGKPVPLVLGFHGSGGTAEKARGMFGLEAKAAGKAIFVYPQGLPDPAFGGDNRWDPTKGSDDFAFIDALIASVETSHCIDRDRVFAVGFSNGARMTSMLGCYRGDVIRAIAPVAPGGNGSTLPLAANACVGEVGIWEGLGTEDADHEKGALIVRDYYRGANGCTATKTATTPSGCEEYQGCRSPLRSIWCTYPGGHMWPSIGAGGVWSFFASFQ